MLTLAFLAAGLSTIWSAFVVFASTTLDMPHPTPFWSVGACWLVTAGLFLWWGVW
jgi:hypothetical protein